jgi:hypothetical protein
MVIIKILAAMLLMTIGAVSAIILMADAMLAPMMMP